MASGGRVGWIVDAQRDFMEPGGRLYVRDLFDETDPGATRIADRLRYVVEWMRAHADLLVYTGDWHHHDDEEIDLLAPDPQAGTYPPHCMGRSDDADERQGAAIIPLVAPSDPIVLELDATLEEARGVAKRALDERRPVFIHKNRFDVFAGNPATAELVAAIDRAIGPLELYVAGVARDVCVTQAVDGLQDRGYSVTAVRDATWGLGLEAEDTTLERWSRRGSVVDSTELPTDAAVANG